MSAVPSCRMSNSLRGPVTRTSRAACVTAPGPAAAGARKPARAGGIFVLHKDRSTNRAGSGDISFESHEVRVRNDTVGDVDRKIIGSIAGAALGHEHEVPRPVIG